MDAGCLADQQLRGAIQAPDLHLLGPEGGDADLAHPDRLVGDGADLVDPRWPFMDLPEVPVEREAVHRHGVHMVQHAVIAHPVHKAGIDR